MNEKINLNDWDLNQIKKYGFVESGEYIIMTRKEWFKFKDKLKEKVKDE